MTDTVKQMSDTINDRDTNEEQKLDIKPLKTQNEMESAWVEIKLQGKLPERRSNHCSWITEHNDCRL